MSQPDPDPQALDAAARACWERSRHLAIVTPESWEEWSERRPGDAEQYRVGVGRIVTDYLAALPVGQWPAPGLVDAARAVVAAYARLGYRATEGTNMAALRDTIDTLAARLPKDTP